MEEMDWSAWYVVPYMLTTSADRHSLSTLEI
jgi:hypothetical protein